MSDVLTNELAAYRREEITKGDEEYNRGFDKAVSLMMQRDERLSALLRDIGKKFPLLLPGILYTINPSEYSETK